MAQVKVYLGGYVSEKLRFNTTTDGVGSDFRAATRLAHHMVWSVGMGGNGAIGDSEIVDANIGRRERRLRIHLQFRQVIGVGHAVVPRS
jgi:ATP-dependent Zn protease